MRIVIKKGDKVVSEPIPMDDVMQRPAPAPRVMNHNFSVTINRPNKNKETNNPSAADKQQHKNDSTDNIANDSDIKKDDLSARDAAKQAFLDSYDTVSTFIPSSDEMNKKEAEVPNPNNEACTVNSNDNYNCMVEPYVNKDTEGNDAYAIASSDDNKVVVEVTSESIPNDSDNATDVAKESEEYTAEESESDESHMAESSDNEDKTSNASDYYAIRGAAGSYNQDTPMFAGDGQTTKFKRKGSNKPQRDENGRFVSTKGNKSNGGYKKKGSHKNRDDDEE